MRAGWDRDKWGNEPPPLTTRLLATLTPLEVDYYECRDVRGELIAYAALRLGKKDVCGWTAEDVASHGVLATLRYGDIEHRSPRWWAIAQRSIRNKVDDLRDADRVRVEHPEVEEGVSEDVEWSWTPTWFSVETRTLLASVLTPREVEALVLTVAEDMSSSEAGCRMGIGSQSVKDLTTKARAKLRINTI